MREGVRIRDLLAVAGWVLALIILSSMICDAATLRVTWDANTETDLAGYRVYIDEEPAIDVGLVTEFQKEFTPAEGQTYDVQVTVYDLTGNESEKSATVSCLYDTVPEAPSGVQAFFAQVVVWLKNIFNTV